MSRKPNQNQTTRSQTTRLVPAVLSSVLYLHLHLHLLCRCTCRCRCSKELLPSFPSLPRPDCLSPTQTRPDPSSQPQALSSGAACTSTSTRTCARASFLPLGLPIHSRIHSHSLSPLPPFASPNLSYTPRSHPCHPPTDPVFNPQILSFIPRNPPKSKQFLSQTTARCTKKNKIFLSNTDTTRFQSTKLVCASFISYAPSEPCACVAQAHLIPRGFC